MVSYLIRAFGLGRLDFAEDVVQDTLCRAMETWSVHGLQIIPRRGSCGRPVIGLSIS